MKAGILINKAGKKKNSISSSELKKIALLEDNLRKRNEAILIQLQENIEIKRVSMEKTKSKMDRA